MKMDSAGYYSVISSGHQMNALSNNRVQNEYSDFYMKFRHLLGFSSASFRLLASKDSYRWYSRNRYFYTFSAISR